MSALSCRYLKRCAVWLLLLAVTSVAHADPAVVLIEGKVKAPQELTLEAAQQLWPEQVKLLDFSMKERQERGYAIELLHCLEVSGLDHESGKMRISALSCWPSAPTATLLRSA